MENAPRPRMEGNSRAAAPANPNILQDRESRRLRRRRWVQERIERQRARLFAVMTVAHGIVDLSLRQQQHPRVRQQVRAKIARRFGYKPPGLWTRV